MEQMVKKFPAFLKLVTARECHWTPSWLIKIWSTSSFFTTQVNGVLPFMSRSPKEFFPCQISVCVSETVRQI